MAVTPLTPLQKRVFTLRNKCCFQLSVYMCEKPASFVYQDRKRLQDKPITAQNNLGTCRHRRKKQSFFPTESPSECKYASSLRCLKINMILVYFSQVNGMGLLF